MNQLFDTGIVEPSGLFIGMDEAGYGPNLGPLVIAATVWETPEEPESCDFAALLKAVVDLKSTCKKTKLHIADSKLVNTGKHGFASLETSALVLLGMAHVDTSSFVSICRGIGGFATGSDDPFATVPWFQDDIKLPRVADGKVIQKLFVRLQQASAAENLHCRRIEAEIVPAESFNQLLDRHGSKGVALSTLAFQLLGRVWQPTQTASTMFVGDKHGGRNYYGDFLETVADHQPIRIIEEGQSASCYQIGSTNFRFQTKGEQHLPVAAASIIAKYIRELSMEQFNAYWQNFCPTVKTTKGYPLDAKRFREEIKDAQQNAGVTDDVLWRKR